MEQISNDKRLTWFLLLIAYFFVGYMGLNFFNLDRSYYVDVSLPFERDIPFVPEAIFGYLLVYVSIFLPYFLITEEKPFRRAIIAFFLVTTIHYLFFFLVPVKMTLRPELLHATGFSAWLTKWYYVIDQPTNLFPSLHVAYPTTATWMIWQTSPRWRIPFVAMTATIAISVILVKQHYIADAVAGCLIALLVCWAIKR